MPELAVGKAEGSADAWASFLDDLAERWSPTATERKQDRSRRREHEIVQAALRVFARDGIARARISDVAAEAGMPVSSIYEYCPSKEDLAYAVPLVQLGSFFSEYSQKARSASTARERLRLYLWMAADFARRHPDWARTLYLEVWPSVLVAESRVRAGLDEYANIIVQLLRSGEAAGEWAGGHDHYETANILIGGFNQLIIVWLMYRRPRDINRAASSLIGRMLKGFLGPAPTPGDAKGGTARTRSRVSTAAAPQAARGRGHAKVRAGGRETE